MDPDARRGRMLVEESREAVVILDDSDTCPARQQARAAVDRRDQRGRAGSRTDSSRAGSGSCPLIVPYEVGGRRERLVYLSQVGDMTAYEELRTGFTAAVSHELRTPLARLLSLLETATLPGEDVHALVDQARDEVESVRELIDEVLFLWSSSRAAASSRSAPSRAARARRRRCRARGARRPGGRRAVASRATRRSSSRCGRGCCA